MASARVNDVRMAVADGARALRGALSVLAEDSVMIRYSQPNENSWEHSYCD